MGQETNRAEKVGFFKRIRKNPVVRAINRFLRSPYFLLFLAIYSIATNIFAIEIYTYTAIVGIATYVVIFSSDFLPLIPMFAFSYLSPSGNNNPANNNASIFSFSGKGKYLLIILGVFIFFTLIRLIFDKEIGFVSIKKKKFKLFKGIIFVSVAFLLSGVLSDNYREIAIRNITFVGLELASLFLLYFFFSFTVKWKKVSGEYFCIMATYLAVVTVVELVNIYRVYEVISNSGVINKDKLSTGWGKSNNLGCMLAMTLPCIFLFVRNRKYGFLLLPLATLVLIATVFTLSRASIIFSAVAFFVGCYASIFNKRYGIRNIITLCLLIGGTVALYILFKNNFATLFKNLLKKGMDNNGRFEIYEKAIAQFLQKPIFGLSFYLPDFNIRGWKNTALSSILPPLMHNTIIQILASCGVVGIVAYLFHRVETIIILIKRFTEAKFFIALSVFGLLLMSLLDCHIFNLGPGLYYALALVFIENARKPKRKPADADKKE